MSNLVESSKIDGLENEEGGFGSWYEMSWKWNPKKLY